MPNLRITDSVPEPGLKSVITPATVITGEINGQGDLLLEGQVTGNIDIDGLLFVGKKGSFKGEARVANMVIEGRVEGHLQATAKIEIRSSGHILGSIVCQKIAIAEGAFFDGKIKTNKGKTLTPEYFVEKRKELLNG
jgi:cytoskeletal protein CcmA (bactofilin family)